MEIASPPSSAPVPPNQRPRVSEIAKANLKHLWERAAKIVVPIAAVGGFVGDVLAPIGPFVTALTILTCVLCVLSGIVWFGFKRRQIRRALVDGVIDESEASRIGGVDAWSVAFAFNLVASCVLLIFFGAQKVFAQGAPERGVFANVVPEVGALQERLLGLEKMTARIEESTKKIEVSSERIESKTDELRKSIESLDQKVAGLGTVGPAGEAVAHVGECKADVEVSPYGKFFEADDVSVEMAIVNAKNADGAQDAILRFRGQAALEAGIDGQAIRYFGKPGYGGGTDYSYRDGGREPVRMIVRPGDDGELVRVFLKDDRAIDLKINKAKSKSLCPTELVP